MKKLIIAFALLTISIRIYAQEGETIFHAKLTKEEVPKVILESFEKDFPEKTVVDFYGIPIEVVEDDWFVDINKPIYDKDYDSYSLDFSGKGREISAIYNKEGKLLSEYEKLQNFPLPRIIQTAVGTHFAGWGVVGDKVVLTAHNGHQKKVHYKVNLQNGDKNIHVVFDSNGNVLKGKQ